MNSNRKGILDAITIYNTNIIIIAGSSSNNSTTTTSDDNDVYVW
jgi:hypothetical protein